MVKSIFKFVTIIFIINQFNFAIQAQSSSLDKCKVFDRPIVDVLNEFDYYRHACLVFKSKENNDMLAKLKCEENDVFNPWYRERDGAVVPFCPFGIASLSNYCKRGIKDKDTARSPDPNNNGAHKKVDKDKLPKLDTNDLKSVGEALKEFYNKNRNHSHHGLGIGGKDVVSGAINRHFGIGSNCVGSWKVEETTSPAPAPQEKEKEKDDDPEPGPAIS